MIIYLKAVIYVSMKSDMSIGSVWVESLYEKQITKISLFGNLRQNINILCYFLVKNNEVRRYNITETVDVTYYINKIIHLASCKN